MKEIIISGFISVKSVLESKSRMVKKLIYDNDRYNTVHRSDFHLAEKRQYEALQKFGVVTDFVTKSDFLQICSAGTSGGIAAIVYEREYLSPQQLLAGKNQFIVILDGIEDPFNFGHSLRTLYAAGVDGIILPNRSFLDSDDLVIRASAGASELFKTAVADDLAQVCLEAKQKGYTIITTAKNNKSRDLYRIKPTRPLLLVFGGEKRGVSSKIEEIADMSVKIKYPRECHFSLSSTSAVSIISFEIARKLSENIIKRIK